MRVQSPSPGRQALAHWDRKLHTFERLWASGGAIGAGAGPRLNWERLLCFGMLRVEEKLWRGQGVTRCCNFLTRGASALHGRERSIKMAHAPR
jgi:hypothetical protein